MARDLVDCLMSCCNEDQLTGTEELSALLRAGCAAFFGEDKRTFYEASKFLVLGKREMAPGRANESLALANAKQVTSTGALPLVNRQTRLRFGNTLAGAERDRVVDGICLPSQQCRPTHCW